MFGSGAPGPLPIRDGVSTFGSWYLVFGDDGIPDGAGVDCSQAVKVLFCRSLRMSCITDNFGILDL